MAAADGVGAVTVHRLEGSAVSVAAVNGVFDDADTLADLGCYVRRVPRGSSPVRDVIDFGFLGLALLRAVATRTREFRWPGASATSATHSRIQRLRSTEARGH